MSKQNILIWVLIGMILYSPACTQAPTVPSEPPVVVPVPNAPPVPVQDVPTIPSVDPTVGSFEVYPGCTPTPSSYAKTIYVDAVHGDDLKGDGGPLSPFKTLNKIKGGEHVVIMPGDYGILTTNTVKGLTSGQWTHLDFQKGATSSFVDLKGISKVIFSGLEASGMTLNKYVMSFTGSDIVVAGNTVMSAKKMPTTVAEWLGLSNGISIDGVRCGSVLSNNLMFVRHGFAPGMKGTTPPANSAKQLIKGNELYAFSGDGSRMNASDLMIIGNTFKDGYVGTSNGDSNHDDMVQGFKLDGGWYENILIEGNTFIDNASSGKKFPTEYQGIGIFDGVFKKVTVRKNVILTGAYHGISLNGVTDGLVENNTLISTSSKSLWIASSFGKKGEPVVNMVVKNNLATKLTTKNWTVNANNFVVTNPSNEFVKFDKVNGLFDMHLKTTSQFSGKGAGAL